MRKEIYLPTPTNPTFSCIGDSYFFEKHKHWKLAVMLGYSWKDCTVTQRGFSFFNRGNCGENIIKKLIELGIKFTTSVSAGRWSFLVNISMRKSNLELISKLYDKYFVETAKMIYESGDFYKYYNEFINEEERQYIINELKIDADYYHKVTCIEDITENHKDNGK